MQASTQGDQTERTSTGKFEMYIATTVKPGQKGSSAVRRMVPPPRGNDAQKQVAIKQLSKQTVEMESSAQHEGASVTQQKAAAQNRAVRAELASLTTQLKSKNSQLSKTDTALRSEFHSMVSTQSHTLTMHSLQLEQLVRCTFGMRLQVHCQDCSELVCLSHQPCISSASACVFAHLAIGSASSAVPPDAAALLQAA